MRFGIVVVQVVAIAGCHKGKESFLPTLSGLRSLLLVREYGGDAAILNNNQGQIFLYTWRPTFLLLRGGY